MVIGIVRNRILMVGQGARVIIVKDEGKGSGRGLRKCPNIERPERKERERERRCPNMKSPKSRKEMGDVRSRILMVGQGAM